MSPGLLVALADGVLALHVAIVIFVVGLPLLVVIGAARRWRFTTHVPLRVAHLAAIAIVVGESWSGVLCPLTTLEAWLRTRAGESAYDGGFVEHWLQSLLFYQAPPWVFVTAYSLFGVFVLATWWWFPPSFAKRATPAVAAAAPSRSTTVVRPPVTATDPRFVAPPMRGSRIER